MGETCCLSEARVKSCVDAVRHEGVRARSAAVTLVAFATSRCRSSAPAPPFTVPQDVDQARLSVRVSVASAPR